MNYYIGLPNNHGHLFWTGEGFSPSQYEAKAYRTESGAVKGCSAVYRKTGFYAGIVFDSENGDHYTIGTPNWERYVMSCNGQLTKNFPKHEDANRYN